MRGNTALVILMMVGLTGIGILKLSLDSLKKSDMNLGCRATTTTGEIDPTKTVAYWQGEAIPSLLSLSDSLSANEHKVLGTNASGDERWIEVDLSEQKLTAWDGKDIFLQTPISSGLYGKTNTGEFHIWYKIRATLMQGGIRGTGTYYYLPNVPYNMFFDGDIAVHGTYWHQNFGHPMSHGCVNTPTPIAEKLFYWTGPQLPDGQLAVKASPDNPGTKVVVHE